MSTVTDTTAGELTSDDLGALVEFRTQLADGNITADLTGTLFAVRHHEGVADIEINDHTGTNLIAIMFVVPDHTTVKVTR